MKNNNWLRDIALAILALTLVFYALVGSLYLHGTRHANSTATTCDKVQRIDGTLYCMAIMHEEDDNITIIRSEK